MASQNGRVSMANLADMRATDKLGKRKSKVDKFVPPDIKMKLNTAGIDKEKMKKAMAPRVRPGGRNAKPARQKTDIFALIDHGIEMTPTEEALAKLAAEKAARDAPIPELLVKPKPPEPEPQPEPQPEPAPKPEIKPEPVPAPAPPPTLPAPVPLPDLREESLAEIEEEPLNEEVKEEKKKTTIKPLELDLDQPIKAIKSRKPKKSKSIDTDPEKKKSKRVSVRNLAPKRNKSVDEDLIEQKKKDPKQKKKSKSLEIDDDLSKKSKKKGKKEKRRSIDADDSQSKTSKKKEKRRSLSTDSNLSMQSSRSGDSQTNFHDSTPDFDAINAIKERRRNRERSEKDPAAEPVIHSFFDAPIDKDAEELRKDIDDVNDQIDNSEKQLKEELAKLKAEFEARKKELDKEFGPQIHQIKEQIAKSAKTNENLQSGAQKIIEKLREENKKLRAEADKYPPMILELRQKNYTLEKTNAQIAETFEGLKKMDMKLQGDHEKLHAQNEKCRDEYLPKYRAELRMRQKHIEGEQAIKEIYRETAVKITNRVTHTRDPDLIEEITNMVIDIEGELNPKFDPKILFADESDSSSDDDSDDSDADSDF